MGTQEVVLAAERSFQTVVAIRDELRDGVDLVWPDHRLYWDSTAMGIWTLRQITRGQQGNEPLDLDAIRAVKAANLDDRKIANPPAASATK